MKLIKVFIQSNIYIALAAVFLTVATQLQLGSNPQWHPYLFLIFFATLFEYNLHRLITVITNKEALQDPKHKWVNNNLPAFYFIVAVSVIGFVIAVLLAKNTVLITLIPIALITLFYSTPLTNKSKGLFRLRQIPFLKIFLIAFVWSTITILLPVIHSGISILHTHVLSMLVERFLFVFAITLPFDVRDIDADKQEGLQTIPLHIGENNAMRLANFSLGLCFGICLVHYIYTQQWFIIPAICISVISTFIFLKNKYLKTLPLYHYGILDGTMLLQGLLVLLFYYLCS
ncbi:MAG: UbiA family prenyltransferase [Bacteroidota bacterium]